jgi:predicted MFS family arabinose efflux permease
VLVSRLVIGWLLDRHAPHRIAAVSLLVAACGLVVWSLAGASMGGALLAAALIGTSIGAELDFLSFFCARHFGTRHYGQVYGVASVFFNLGIALGGLTFGVLHGAFGQYGPALGLACALLVVASAAFALLGREPVFSPR